ncbi:RlpA family protein [Bradyrhizobium oligotrophicum S58]|uniref:Endolytic peptidoglycan transglycosylase RlpA n=1 Tax=Bradyrhizobium oligotrophicum S58 TaxID=1245469 RepID=M4ZUZ1_9BRAD|nr:septal ring lytic transglycosylase RlpA family protein [Bradyrhizobium oligotrophicum]BAM90115.1 RlpA family protein [Bradyrhizobium oligotrophicum S58]
MAETRRGRALGVANAAGASWSHQRTDDAAGGTVLVRRLVAAMFAATLTACARSPDVGGGLAKGAAGQQAALTQTAPAQPAPQASPIPQTTVPPVASAPPRRPRYVPRGLASYYTAPQPTANGEVFDTTAMTAAHRSLPFGTRLRVTRLDTGRAVTVRINDRGPYVDGRVVDLSYAAAAALDMVDSGLANVRLDVVRWPKPRVPKSLAPVNARPLARPAPTRLSLLQFLGVAQTGK